MFVCALPVECRAATPLKVGFNWGGSVANYTDLPEFTIVFNVLIVDSRNVNMINVLQ